MPFIRGERDIPPGVYGGTIHLRPPSGRPNAGGLRVYWLQVEDRQQIDVSDLVTSGQIIVE
jgi:hypothetical protein